jgi:hypothetical protein
VNIEDVGLVLAKLAAFDQRTVGNADLLAWHEVIGHMDVQDCLAAVTEHYRESANRAMPADIRRIAISLRDARHSRERVTERREAIESGPTVRDRSAEVTALVASVAASLPQPTNHDRALARARRDRGRPYQAPTKERRQPKQPKDHPPPATDDVAAMATRYLLDGHEPHEVAERLAVSRRWCERTAKTLRQPREDAA